MRLRHGFTLIEIMIATVISLVLTSALGYGIFQARLILGAQTASMSFGEDARLLDDIFRKIITQARRPHWFHDRSPLLPAPSLRNNDRLFVGGTSAYSPVMVAVGMPLGAAPSMPITSGSLPCPIISANGSTPTQSEPSSDCLIISYAGSGPSAPSATSTLLLGEGNGGIVDCFGNAIGIFSIVANQLYVANGALRCRTYYLHFNQLISPSVVIPSTIVNTQVESSNNNDDAILSNVESMRFLYGEDLGVSTCCQIGAFSLPSDQDALYEFEPSRWVPAGTSNLDMRRVVAIRYSIIIRTNIIDRIMPNQTIYHFNENVANILGADYSYTPPNDGHVRRVLTGTIIFKNRPTDWAERRV